MNPCLSFGRCWQVLIIIICVVVAIISFIVGIIAIRHAVKEKNKATAWGGGFALCAFIFSVIVILFNPTFGVSTTSDTSIDSVTTNGQQYQLGNDIGYVYQSYIPVGYNEYQTLPSMEYILIGTWHGEYSAGQGRTSLNLIITDYTDGIISAYFHFSPHPENPAFTLSGLYSMSGGVTEDMSISLVGQEWIVRPGGFGFIDIFGMLDIDAMIISSNEASLLVSKISNEITLPQNINVISNEGYLTSLDPWRLDGVNGFMIIVTELEKGLKAL